MHLPSALMTLCRALSVASLLSSGAVTTGATARDARDIVIVTLDQARTVRMPEGTKTLIIGNPVVADVTVLKNNELLVITGKSYGETNMIALDAGGSPVGESTIRVTSASNTMIVQRGMDRESYQCAPRCQPVYNIGDKVEFSAAVTTGIKTRNDLAKPDIGTRR